MSFLEEVHEITLALFSRQKNCTRHDIYCILKLNIFFSQNQDTIQFYPKAGLRSDSSARLKLQERDSAEFHIL